MSEGKGASLPMMPSKAPNKASGERFHNHSRLTFEKLKGDPDHIEKHIVSYIKGFSRNVRTIFDFFEFENEIEKMREANILYLVVSKFSDVDLHPFVVPNEQMGLIFENLIRRFNELANETAGDHFTPREVIRLMVNILFIDDDDLLSTPGTVRKYWTLPAELAACLLSRKIIFVTIMPRRNSTFVRTITSERTLRPLQTC